MITDRKVKLLFFIEQVSVSYKYFENIFKQLSRNSLVIIEVFNLYRSKEVNDHLAQFCHKIYSLPDDRGYKKNVWNIKKIIQRSNPDIIHAHEVIPCFYAAIGIWLGFSKAKLIFHRHHSFYRNKATKLMERIAFFKSNIAISVSKAAQLQAFNEHPHLKNKILQIYNGVTVEDNGMALPIDINEYEEYSKIVLIARLRSKKGHETAIDAINIVRNKIPKIVLFFAGDGELKASLAELIIKKNLQQNVIILGDVQNISSLIKAIDISILPSESEAFNLSILETFACRKLSIASNLPSIKECITDNETGVLIEPNNPDQLAEKIINYLQNGSERSRMESNAYKLYKEKFTTEHMVKQIIEVYKRLSAIRS